MSPQIEKAQFRNETEGWVGAVRIGVKGDERGVAVAPGETVWLSEPEQVLTANAPRRAEDNPFIPQPRIKVDPVTGERTEFMVTPLIRVSEDRFVPTSDRPIPGDLPQAPAAAPAAPAASEAPAPVEPPVAPPAPPQAPQAPVPAPDPTPASPEAEAPVAPAVAEETAAQSPGPQAEETGAALPPVSEAPEGEYAALEEVGTPDAPTADAPAPAPWSPSTEE